MSDIWPKPPIMIEALAALNDPAVDIVIRRFLACEENAEAYQEIDPQQAQEYRQLARGVIPIIRALYKHFISKEG